MIQRISGIVVLIATLVAPAHAQNAAAIEKTLIGAWRLVSYTQRMADGTTRPSPAAGPNGTGYLIYTDTHRMCAVIMNPDRAPARGQAAGGGGDAASTVTISYCGRYEVNAAEGSILHHVEVDRSLSIVGTARKRFFSVSGNRLSLRMPPAQGVTEATLIWERFDN